MLETLIEAIRSLVIIVTPLNLFVVSFIEAIFFPIPPDAVLIPLVMLRPSGGLLYAALATGGSVLGALVGYALGYRGGQAVLARMATPQRLGQVGDLLNRYDVWAILIAGFTPVPYKVFAIAAGVFSLNMRRFIVASVISRGARFALIAGLLMLYGESIAQFLQDNLEWVTIGLMAVVLLVAGIYRIIVVYRKNDSPS